MRSWNASRPCRASLLAATLALAASAGAALPPPAHAQDAAAPPAADADDDAPVPAAAADAGPADAPAAPPDTNAADAPADVAELLARFARMEGLEATFSEEKHLTLLASPLRSRGRLYFLPPGHLARVVEEPMPSRVVISPTTLRLETSDGVETIDLSQSEDVRTFVTALVHVFAGDRQALEALYDADYARDGRSWTLVLRPRERPLSEFVRELRLDGRGAGVESVTVVEPDGDRTVTRVEHADIARRFSAEERERLFGIPARG